MSKRSGTKSRKNKKSSGDASKNGAVTTTALWDSDRLPWWHDLISSTVLSPVTGNQRAIFTNRTLRLEKVEAIGFDFDHTLAIYNCPALDQLAMQLVIDRLIEKEGFDPKFTRKLPELSFARKGLIVDLELGNVLKTDRYGHVKRAYHGKNLLTSEDKKKLYSKIDVIPHVTQGQRFIQADSAFANPEILIFSALAPRTPEGQCQALWKTIRKHTDSIHRDGSLKQVITANPLDFLHPDTNTIATLRHLKEGGKKLFLLTNSEWEYTCAMMNPALGLGTHEGLEWLELFDLVVAEARKPSYFSPGAGQTQSVVGPEKVVRGGNIDNLEEHLGAVGTEILYVGDHIYADLITSKRKQHWRTMLIISELEEELEVQSVLPGMADQIHNVDSRRTETERMVHHWKAIEAALQRLPKGDHGALAQEFRKECARNRKHATKALQQHIRQREKLRSKLSQVTNKYWGSLFRADNELTYYGRQLEDFACAYTSRATNLGAYATDHYFRSAMDYLPHELESMA